MSNRPPIAELVSGGPYRGHTVAVYSWKEGNARVFVAEIDDGRHATPVHFGVHGVIAAAYELVNELEAGRLSKKENP